MSPARSSLRVVLALGLLVGAAACGSDDSSSSPSTPQPTGTASTGTASVDTAGSGDGGIVEQIGGEGAGDAISSLGIGTKASALASALGSDRDPEILDDTTARIFLEGDVDADAIMACIVVGAIIDPDETVIVAYPNGETTCE